MDHVWAANASPTPPAMPVSLEFGFPTEIGPATNIGAWWFHMVTEELRNTLVAGNVTPNGGVLNQLSVAVANIARKAVSVGNIAPVRVIDTAGGALSGARTIDGVVLITGDRVLRNTTSSASNGVYVVNTSGAWLRSEDLFEGQVVLEGIAMSVSDGSTNASTLWVMNPVSGDTATIGTTAIRFSDVTGTLKGELLSYAPLAAPRFTGVVGLTDYAPGTVLYINANRDLVGTGSMTYDGTTLNVAGPIVAERIVFQDNTTLHSASLALGGGNDKIFYESDVAMTHDYAITPGKNAWAAGPLDTAGHTITIPVGSHLTIV